MRLIVLNILLLTFFDSQGQSNKQGVFAFIKVQTNLINEKPISLKFNSEDLFDYLFDYININKISKSDSISIEEMISKKINDTTSWSIEEIPNAYLVKNNQILNSFTLKYKFKKDSINARLKKISSMPKEHLVYSVSRPIFNKKSTLALVQFELLNQKNEGYILVKLFKKKYGIWNEVDTLYSAKRETKYPCSIPEIAQ